MPISAQQWRVKTGAMNASKGFKPNSIKSPPSLFDLPPPPPPDWKGYNTALVLVFLPLLCRIYAVGMAVMAHIARGGLGPCEYVSTAGSSLDIRTSYTSYHQQSAVFLGLVFYLSMVIGVVFVSVWEYRERGKHHLKLIQPLPDVNFAWLEVEGGREGSVHVRPRMISGCIYAMIEMDTQSSLKCVRNTGNSRKRVHAVSEFTCVGVVSFALRWSTAVLAMLLLMAGDVERNPGPPPNVPKNPDLLVMEKLRKIHQLRTELSTAAGKGDVDRVSSILRDSRKDLDVNFIQPQLDPRSFTPVWPPLLKACEAGHLEVVRVLLKHKDIQVNRRHGNWTPLSIAAAGGHTETVRLLLEHGAIVDDLKGRALSCAISNGQHSAAALLLESGAKVNPDNICFENAPLMKAVSSGHAKMAELLLDYGAEIDSKHPNIVHSPLTTACERGDTECTKLLIERGAKIDGETQSGTALIQAVRREHTECAKLLLEAQADPNKSTRDYETPLMLASRNRRIDDVQLLLSHHAEVNTVSSRKDTALSLACDDDHVEVAEVLIKNGAHVNQETSDQGKSILLKAIGSRKFDIASLLLQSGATVDTSDSRGNTPLTCAVEKKDVGIVKQLLEHSAVVDRKSLSISLSAKSYEIIEILLRSADDDLLRDEPAAHDILSAFLTAARNGDCTLAEILLPHVANIDTQFDSGDTPLMAAAGNGHTTLMKLLLDHGAQPNIQSAKGDSALILASHGGHAECVELLLQQEDIDINTQNNDEHTALMVASERGHASVVQLLLEHGADLGISDTRGCSALFYGVKSNNVAVVEKLLAKGANACRKTVDEKTVIQYAYECGKPDKRIVKMLQEAKSSSHTPHPDHTTSTVVDELTTVTISSPEIGRIYSDFHPADDTLDLSQDFSATKCWGLDSIHSTLDGTGVRIAVIVAGVNVEHIAFKPQVEEQKGALKRTIQGLNFVTNAPPNAWRTQPSRHGTMVAFVAAGRGFKGIHVDSQTGRKVELKVNSGVAPNSSLVICSVGETYSMRYVRWALEVLIDRKKKGKVEVDVVCMSFGDRNDPRNEGQQRIKELIKQLRDLNVIMVAAAGNHGKNCDGVLFPACLSDVISVGALNHTGYKRETNHPSDIDVYAPGEAIAHPSFDSKEGVKFSSGSFCATPAVAGLVALLVQLSRKYPTLNFKVDLDYVRTVLKREMKKRGDFVLLDPQEYFQRLLLEHEMKLKDLEIQREYFQSNIERERLRAASEDLGDPSEAKHLAAVDRAMKEKGTLEHTLAHGVFTGPARSGKSSLMTRLVGEMPSPTSPSTGVAEQAIHVGVKKSSSIALSVLDSIWFKLLYDEEAIRLMTLASHNVPFPPQQPAASLTDRTPSPPTTLLQSDPENELPTVTLPTPLLHGEPENAALPTSAKRDTVSLPAGYVAPMGVFKAALRGRGLEGLRRHFENSWSFYLTDTGGQIEFQELLPLLVSGPSLFFITFRLDQGLHQRFTIEYHLPDGGRSEPYQSTLTVVEAILQTLASIASMGTFVYKGPQTESIPLKPKVIIVGTHKDMLNPATADSDIKKIDQYLQGVIKSTSHYKDLVTFATRYQMIYTVNNLSEDDSDFVKIRSGVERVVCRPKFKMSFPSHWLIFSLVVRQEMIKDSIISFEQCSAIAQDCGITDHEELYHALWFLHTKIGLIRHFPTPGLSHFVIRRPQILFDMVTKLIVNTFTFENVGLRRSTEFRKKGIFTLEDFKQIDRASTPLLPPEKLLQLLQHLRIVAPFEGKGQRKYFLPCVLAHSEESESPSSPQSSDIPPLLITFECGYCPKGLYGTLVLCLLTNDAGSKFKWELMTDQIFRDQVTFIVSPYDTITLKIDPKYLEIIHSCITESKREQNIEDVCNNVRLSVEESIRKVSSDMKLTSYAKHSLSFYCGHADCTPKEAHPATKISKDEDGSLCYLWCKMSGKTLRSTLPAGYSVWFGNEEGSKKDREQDSEKEVEAELLAAVDQAMKEKGELKHTLAHGVFTGPAGSGKSSLMKRLVGEDASTTSPSTGVAEQAGVYSVALKVEDHIWFKLQYNQELIRLMKLASHNIVYTSQQPAASLTDHTLSPPPVQSGPENESPTVTPPTPQLNKAKEESKASAEPTNVQPTSTSTEVDTRHTYEQSSHPYKSPLDVFKDALERTDLEGLRQHFENSWSLYLTDAGGQIEFQELLPLLVSGPSMLFITFRLDQDLRQRPMIEYRLPDGGRSEPYQSPLTVVEAILQTLASIASMSSFVNESPQMKSNPKVFIVGTHKDKLHPATADSDIKKIDQYLQEVITPTSHYRDLVEFATEYQMIYTVNNFSEDDTDFKKIRSGVKRVVCRSNFEMSFPSPWLIFGLVLRQEMIKDSIISFEQCSTMAEDCGITDHEELEQALWFLHTKIGLIRHFPTPGLRDLVFRHPQILFDMVTKLIVNTFTFENVGKPLSTEFKKKGIFTLHDFKQIEQGLTPLLPPEKLLKLLEHLRMVAPFEEKDQRKYFLPCVLAHSEEFESPSSPQSSDIPPLLITFECGYCPKGLYGALLVCLLTNDVGSKFKWELMTNEIFRDQVTFDVSPYDTITLKIHPKYLEIIHSYTMTSIRAQKVEDVCNKVCLSVEKGIRKVSSDMKLTSYAKHSLSFYCGHPDCTPKEAHPATKISEDEGGSLCNLCCRKSGRTLRSDLPARYYVWCGEGREEIEHSVTTTRPKRALAAIPGPDHMCGTTIVGDEPPAADELASSRSKKRKLEVATSQRDLSTCTCMTRPKRALAATTGPDHTTATVGDEPLTKELIPASSQPKKQKTEGEALKGRGTVVPAVHWNLGNLHTKGVTGEGVVIAILDGGVDTSHELIDADRLVKIGQSSSPQGYWTADFVQLANEPNSTQYTQHGTAVTAVAGCGLRNQDGQYLYSGIAPGAKFLICRVSHTDSDNNFDPVAVKNALRYLVQWKPLDIVCMSFHVPANEEVEQLLSELARNKVICVAAAGNSGHIQKGAFFPASNSNVLSVGALTPEGRDSGITPDSGVDVCAPGEDIVVPVADTTNLTDIGDGTSLATPMVVGFLALLLQLTGKMSINIATKFRDINFLRTLFATHWFCQDTKIQAEFVEEFLGQFLKPDIADAQEAAVKIIRKQYPIFQP